MESGINWKISFASEKFDRDVEILKFGLDNKIFINLKLRNKIYVIFFARSFLADFQCG